MILKHADWQAISAQFTYEEKESIRFHIAGDRPNKVGWVIDTDSMAAELRTKLMDAVTNLHKDSVTAGRKDSRTKV